jgi:exopolysaccharide biosynthesis polyprenyl glycosylphosphotransferase
VIHLATGAVSRRRPAREAGGRGARLLVERLRQVGLSGQGIPEGPDTTDARVRDAAFRRSLAVADALAVAPALVLGVAVLGGHSLRWGVAIPVLLFIGLAKVMGLYDRDEHVLRKTTLDEAPKLFYAVTLSTLLVWLGQEILVRGSLGQLTVLATWVLLFAFAVLFRTIARRLVASRVPIERCLMVGDPGSVADLSRRLANNPGLNAELVGWIPIGDDEPAVIAGVPAVGSKATLGLALVEHEVHRVIVVPPAEGSGERVLDSIRLVKALGVKVSLLPGLVEVVESAVEFDDASGLPLLGVRRYGLTRSSLVLKRWFDALGSAGLLVVATPFVMVAALAIRLDSKGPVFFRQTRIGRNGREFEMLKFRTMEDGADGRRDGLLPLNEAEGLFKMIDDPRVTRVGRFLRRTSLDELPQLINVLRGDMSLVGPRPLVSDDDARVEGWDRRRLLMPPGMTGLWQVMGSARIPLREMVKLDYLYAANWSLWLDVKVLLRTLSYVVRGQGM